MSTTIYKARAIFASVCNKVKGLRLGGRLNHWALKMARRWVAWASARLLVYSFMMLLCITRFAGAFVGGHLYISRMCASLQTCHM